ncbi:MAG: hypothetical protein IPI73_31040 [Betaproteobacteria bacterium]|nr:hypothetical protein [Betaproteobacteria bacterium]
MPPVILPAPAEYGQSGAGVFFGSARQLAHLGATGIRACDRDRVVLGALLALAHYAAWSAPAIHRRLSPSSTRSRA